MSSKEIKIFYSLQIVSECCRQHPGLSLLVCLLHTTPACNLLAAVGACMYHILAAIHTEGDQATAKVTAESRNHKVNVLKLRTLVSNKPRQTEQTQIRLLLQKQSDQGLPCLLL